MKHLKEGYNKDSFTYGYILGVLLGDGYVTRTKNVYRIGLNVRDKDFAEFFKVQLEKWSGHKTIIRELETFHKREYRIVLYSVQAYNFLRPLKNESEPLIWVRNMSNSFKKGFVKGFIDSEGCIIITTFKNRLINIANTNVFYLRLVSDCLNDLGISTRRIMEHNSKDTSIIENGKKRVIKKKKQAYQLCFGGMHNLIKYKDRIGFTIRRKQEKLAKAIETGQGRTASKYSNEQFKLYSSFMKNNTPIKEISKKLNINLYTLYYWKNNPPKYLTGEARVYNIIGGLDSGS